MPVETKKTIGIIGQLPRHFDTSRFGGEDALVITLGVLNEEAIAALILSEGYDELVVIHPDTAVANFLLNCSYPALMVTAQETPFIPQATVPEKN